MAESKNKTMSQEGHWHFTGKEDRRKTIRRAGHDRRDMIRFELDKDDRRSHKERRRGARSWGSDKPI